MGARTDRDKLAFQWAFSSRGLLLCVHLLFSTGFVFYMLASGRYAILNMLFVALGPGFPLTSRLILGGYLLLGGLFLVVPLPAGILSTTAQVRNALALTHLRQLEQRAGIVLPASVRFVEQWARNPFAPIVVRNQAIITWSRQIAPTRPLPLLVRIVLEPGTAIETRGVAQKAIDEIGNRWRRQPHDDSFDTMLTEALLAFALTPDDFSDDARPTLLHWINQPPESTDKRIILAALLQREGKYAEAAEIISQPVALESDNTDLHLSYVYALFDAHRYAESVASIEALVAAEGKRHWAPTAARSMQPWNLVEGTLMIAILTPFFWIGIRPEWLRDWLAHGHNQLGGYVEEKTRSHVLAIERYTNAIHLLPDQALLYRNRADSLILLGRFAEAATDLDKAAELEPNHSTPRRW